MTTLENVYRILKEKEGDFISGESLASSLGISRAAVWKAVSSLQEKGYEIETRKHHGYRMTPCDDYNELALSRLSPVKVFFHDETASTNDEARRLVSSGEKPPFVVVAARQSGGKGRRGRSFSSPEEAEKAIFDISSEEKGIVYGANIIRPMKHRLSDPFILGRLRKAAAAARENAYAPYSSFKVGAAVLSALTGRIYSGCNMENSSYGATICAERNAITTAIAAEGVIGIDMLAVCSDDDPPAPPCALCLQVMAEFARPETEIILFSVNGDERHYTFSELLPNPFVFPTMRR